MKRRENDSEDLRTALDTWDPVRREGEPSEQQVAALRRRVVAAASASPVPGVVRWRPVLAAAAAAAAVVVVLLHDGGRWSPDPSATAPVPTAAPDAVEGQQVAAQRRASGSTMLDGEVGAATRTQAEAPHRVEPTPIARHGAAGGTGGEAGVAEGPPHRPVVVERVAEVTIAANPPEADAAASPPDRVEGDAGEAGAAGAAAETHQIQIIAPGGTRIVWLVAATPERSTDSSEEDT